MNTPIFDELTEQLDSQLAGEGFWPDYFCAWVVAEATLAVADAVVDAMVKVLAVVLVG